MNLEAECPTCGCAYDADRDLHMIGVGDIATVSCHCTCEFDVALVPLAPVRKLFFFWRRRRGYGGVKVSHRPHEHHLKRRADARLCSGCRKGAAGHHCDLPSVDEA